MVAAAQSAEVFRDVVRSVRAHVRLAHVAADHGAQLVLFPELSLTGYDRALTREDALAFGDARLDPLQLAADEREIVIVAGAPIESGAGLHIGAMTFSPHGAGRVYEKEYLHDGEEVAFAPGRGGECIRIGDQVIGLAVCADVNHAEHPCAAANRGATIYAAGCFVTERGYSEFEQALRAYAERHVMLALMANYAAPTRSFASAGCSAIWSDSGELLARAPATGESIVIACREAEGWRGAVVTVAPSSAT